MGGGNPGRPESGNRIDSRARGNASQLYEKYKTLAGDAQRQGDRVNTEYYLQFADHYFRVLAESRPRFEEQQGQRRGSGAEFDDEFDGDGEEYGQEGEAGQPDQYQPRADDRYRQEERPRQDARPDERARQQRPDGRGDERPRRDGQRPDARQDGRADGRTDERPRQDDRPRQEARSDERPRREDRPRQDGARDQRPRDDGYPRPDRAPIPRTAEAVAADVAPSPAAADDQLTQPRPVTQEASAPRAADMDAPVPRRRGRPPKVRVEEAATAAEPTGLDADRLPPSLSVSASAEPDAGEPADKPRRRRRIAAEPAEAGPAS